jgi:hypothetical protein
MFKYPARVRHCLKADGQVMWNSAAGGMIEEMRE